MEIRYYYVNDCKGYLITDAGWGVVVRCEVEREGEMARGARAINGEISHCEVSFKRTGDFETCCSQFAPRRPIVVKKLDKVNLLRAFLAKTAKEMHKAEFEKRRANGQLSRLGVDENGFLILY